MFAVKARTYSGFVPAAHRHAPPREFTGLSVEQATELADSTEVLGPISATEPRYELWRREIRSYFARSSNRAATR